MPAKRKVTCDLYNEAQERMIVKGRLLGYITEEEFAVIAQHPKVQKGVITSETVSLADLDKASSKLIGKRLVLEAKKIDDRVENKRKLFITDVITEIVCYTDRDNTGIEYMSLETKHNQWLALTEH